MKNYTKNDTEKNTKKYMTWVDIFIMLGLIVCFSIAVPFLINVFYGRGCPLIDAWDKSDLMGYYGSIMTAAAAVAGVYFTLDYSKFKQMDFEKLRVKPHLKIISSVYKIFNTDVFSVKENEVYAYRDMNTVYTTTANGKLPFLLKEIVEESTDDEINKLLKNSFIWTVDLKSVGADSAINTKIILNDEIICNHIDFSKNDEYHLKILIKFDKEMEMQDKVIIEDMNIKIIYENIYGNQLYEQSVHINNLERDKKADTLNYNIYYKEMK